MGRQVTLARESTVAYLADIRPFSGVPASVNCQRRSLRECFRTLIAFVRLLPRVYPSVHPQILGIRKTLSADIADVWFLPGMDPPVLFQVLSATETLAAVIAEIELRGIVALLVSEERSLRGKYAAADIASGAGHFVGLQLGMRASTVRGELSSEIEGVVAELTYERLLARVNVIVLLKIEFLPETLVALVALEWQIRFVHVSRHMNTQSRYNGGLVIALLAHVTR